MVSSNRSLRHRGRFSTEQTGRLVSQRGEAAFRGIPEHHVPAASDFHDGWRGILQREATDCFAADHRAFFAVNQGGAGVKGLPNRREFDRFEASMSGSDGLSTTTRQPQRPEPLLGDGPPRPVLGDALRSRTRVGLVELGLKHRQRRRVGPTSWPAERRGN